MPESGVWPSIRETKAQIAVGYAAENRHLSDYLRSLPPDEWSGPTLHQEWNVKEVVSHLAGQAHDFLDKEIRKATTRASKEGTEAIVPLMVEANKRHIETGSKLSARELIAQCEYLRGIVSVRLAQIPAVMWKLLRIKGVLPMRLSQAMGILVMDAWVYRQDIQRPREHSNGEGPYSILIPSAFFGIEKMRSYDPSGAVNLDLGGHGKWSMLPNSGFQRGFFESAEATVAMEVDEFLLVAAGRIDGDDAKAEVHGKQGLGKEFLYSMRYQGLVPGM